MQGARDVAQRSREQMARGSSALASSQPSWSRPARAEDDSADDSPNASPDDSQQREAAGKRRKGKRSRWELWHFFFRNDASSVPPSDMSLVGAAVLFLCCTVLPIGLVIDDPRGNSLFTLLFGLAMIPVPWFIPQRFIVTEEGVARATAYRWLRQLRTPASVRWQQYVVPWECVRSVKRLRNNSMERRFGPSRFEIRLDDDKTCELHESAPVFARFAELAQRHLPERMEDRRGRWWSFLQ